MSCGIKSMYEDMEAERIEKYSRQIRSAIKKLSNDELVSIVDVMRKDIDAEASKQSQTLIADGQLAVQQRQAEGLAALGTAKAEAEKAMQLAPVQAQITLAKEIGDNKSYQQYLITVEQIKANQAVGTAQAKALEAAEIKVIANSGDVSSGIDSLGSLISSKGGTQIGAMLEGLANTGTGQALMSKFGLADEETTPVAKVSNGSNGKGSYTNGSAGKA